LTSRFSPRRFLPSSKARALSENFEPGSSSS
jgi:hypothetical protein